MFVRRALSVVIRRKTIVLAVAGVFAVAAPAAYAAKVTGDGTLVGTTGSDTLSAGNGNDTIWGLGGLDLITAGNGNDVIDGNGMCPAGLQSGDYPNGLPSADYCTHGQIPGSGNSDAITAGNGNDTIFGGGGFNLITVGGGTDTIFGGPLSDVILAGNGGDTIHLGSGSKYTGSVVAVGSGSGTIFAQNGVKDFISCAGKNNYTVFADKGVDSVSGCKTVIFTPAPSAAARTSAKLVKASAKHTSAKR